MHNYIIIHEDIQYIRMCIYIYVRIIMWLNYAATEYLFYISSLHSWVSFSGFAEAYYDHQCNSQNYTFIKRWASMKKSGMYATYIISYVCYSYGIAKV